MKIRLRAGRVIAASVALIASACATTPTVMAEAQGQPTLADREAIEATLYRYARGLDRLDPELYASAFAPDGELVLGGQTTTGREALAAIVAGVAENRAAAAAAGGPPRVLFHMDANARVEFLAPDHAIHHAYWLTLSRTGEGAESEIAVEAIGSSTDELRKLDGEWLIVRREISTAP